MPSQQRMLSPALSPDLDVARKKSEERKAKLLSTMSAPDEFEMSHLPNSISNIAKTNENYNKGINPSTIPALPLMSGKEKKSKNNERYCTASPNSMKLPRISKNAPPTPTVIVPKKKEEKLKGLARFRRIARMVKTNLAWAKDVREHNEGDSAFVVKSKDGEESEAIIFNIENYKVSNSSYGGLSPRIKNILAKTPCERTSADIAILIEVVRRLKCFDKYSSAAKLELTRIIYYEKFEEGRVVIQEGHIGFSFYFIVSGQVNVLVSEIDKYTGEKHMLHLGELCDGASFGELALLHNIRRTATIICKTNCELLRVDRTDFESVLRTVMNAEYERRCAFMREFPGFADWTLQEILDANFATRIKECPAGAVLSSNNHELIDHFYVIVSGECTMVRELYVLKEIIPLGGYRLKLPLKSKISDYKNIKKNVRGPVLSRRETVSHFIPERRLWSVGNLGRFHYFGVGESLEDTYIVSKTKVDLLVVPKLLFSKLGRSRALDKMRDWFNKIIPDNQLVFQEYYTDFNWRRYKSQVVREIIQRRSLTTKTNITDVPDCIRRDQTFTDQV